MTLTKRFLLLISLFIVGCSIEPIPTAQIEESTVTNGGDELKSQLERIFHAQLKRGLSRLANLELIETKLSKTEITRLHALIDEGIPKAIVSPKQLSTNRYFGPQKSQPALVEGNELLDTRGEAVNARVVWDSKLNRFLIQIDEAYLKYALNIKWDEQASPNLLRLMLHEILRLLYFRGEITFADEDYILSRQIYFPPKHFLKSPVFISGNRKSEIATDGQAFGHKRKEAANATYEGVVNCREAQLENWVGSDGESPASGLCHLQLEFKRNADSLVRGKMKYTLRTHPAMRLLREETTAYFEDESDIIVEHPKTKELLIGELLMFGDVITFATISTVFRREETTSPLSGITFHGEFFPEGASFDFANNVIDIIFDVPSDIDKPETAPVKLEFIDETLVTYEGPFVNIHDEFRPNVKRVGTYRQIGNNVLINFADTESDNPVMPNSVHLWLRPGDRKELVTSSGDSLFEGEIFFEPLKSQYTAMIDCSEVFFIPTFDRVKEEQKLRAGMGCTVKIEFKADGSATISHRAEYPIRGLRKEVTGKVFRGGRHVGIWSETENKFLAVYKALPNGELCDVFRNLYK